MKSEVILDVIGKADDKYIEEAAPKEKRSKKYRWVKRIAMAACLTLAVYVGIRLIPTGISGPNTPAETDSHPNTPAGTEDQPDVPAKAENLPMLSITSGTDAMGFEACLAYDISELDNGNPWTADTQLNTMPVYKNTDFPETAAGIGKECMLKLAKQVADALNMKIISVKYDVNEKSGYKSDTDLAENDVIYRVIAETATAEIEVTKGGTGTVNFNESIELPAEYSFTYTDTSDEEAENVTDYLLKRYSALLSLTNPQKALFADYAFDGSRNRNYYAYDAEGNIAEQIINYNFNKVQFAPDDDGNLMLIRKYNDLSCAEKIGDYPIITSEEALKLLMNGNYLSSVPEEMPGEDYVAKAELVYRTVDSDETFLPYYRFWVELPDMHQENGLKTYGGYYVPAVQQQYISNMPLWDGSFN
ncbi:MAG: hypothetical protein VB078_05810 [Clostridiaceae bacterium]|nr:hypothetical protein [Clostridiaceae bacterium]